METSSPTSSPPTTRHIHRGTFHHLQLVVLVAFVLATLFTAWTPFVLGVNRSNLGSPFSQALQPRTDASGQATATPRSRPLIGIVVGHWGDNEDPGAVCPDGNLTEFKVNQNIATLVKKDLEEKGLDVVLLKEFDNRLNGFQANALVSIHADSCEYINDQATGFKVAAALSNPHPERAARLTACIRNRYSKATSLPLHSTSITNDMTSYHAFGEIDESTTAAIIETGFLNLDRQLLENHPEIPAIGITQGIICFIYNEDVSAPPPPTPTIQLQSTPLP